MKIISIFGTMVMTVILLACQPSDNQLDDVETSSDNKTAEVINDYANFGVLGYHKITLKDSTQADAFEKYSKEEYLPLVDKAFPGMRTLFAKADRGKGNGNYVLLFVFDSLERRNYYIPEPGKLSEKAKEIWESTELEVAWEKLMEFIDSEFVADYVII